jgi:hypothetical protein
MIPKQKPVTFLLRVRALPNVADPIRTLRQALKRLRRSYGLAVVSIEQEPTDGEGKP